MPYLTLMKTLKHKISQALTWKRSLVRQIAFGHGLCFERVPGFNMCGSTVLATVVSRSTPILSSTNWMRECRFFCCCSSIFLQEGNSHIKSAVSCNYWSSDFSRLLSINHTDWKSGTLSSTIVYRNNSLAYRCLLRVTSIVFQYTGNSIMTFIITNQSKML